MNNYIITGTRRPVNAIGTLQEFESMSKAKTALKNYIKALES